MTLDAARRRTLAANMNFLRVTQETLALLGAAGVEVMPLKGALFAARYYPDLAARPQSDVDVLVRESDLDRAHDALLAAGWRLLYDRALYRGHYHWVYRRDDAGLLELHWALKPAGTASPDLARFWREARPVSAEGVAFLEPRREDLLAYLAVNKAAQHFSSLVDFQDLHQVVAAGPLDWDLVVGQAREDGVCGALWFGLVHCRELFETAVPGAALDALARRAAGARALRRLLSWWGGQLRLPASLLEGPFGRLHEAFIEGRLSTAARLLAPLLFPSAARARALGGSYPAYYRARLAAAGRQARLAVFHK